ncbi:preprotein translocase subunit SecY [Paludisphaera borealis]|uniref:Protein translocase subunit SecY n=1 Tax=Paludisphaera borealis TaxID=1387353 RepID=A0A1U7CR26_9BACT|nr:preprotein translocase subunit SecY [Paludisphaera borealis]APW61395.1 Protein translocase subunit SecY [Paludisphaera borealis]MDR3623347.1 preprotein translocase subunit SecY [Paludisphaera borealis]
MDKLLTVFKIPELRRKILFTAMLLAIYRIGFYIPLPIVNQAQLRNWEEQLNSNAAGKIFGTVAMFGGTQIGMSTIFGLGIMPYISASIIFQLLGSVVPSLEAMMKEGESGRKRINEYTRYATVILCAVQSAFWVQYMMSPQMNVVLPQYRDFWHGLICVSVMTSGTVFLMWIGEQIDEYGIGNGISILIMAGILSRMPVALKGLWENSTTRLSPEPGKYGIITLVLLLGLFVAVVVGVIAITESQRRIPTQSAKHVRGRRVFGGTRQFLPLKVNQAGVMPIIFASSLLIFPSFVLNSLARATQSLRSETWSFGSMLAGGIQEMADAFQRQSYVYTVCNIILIYFFCYFWTAITFNPKDMAENLKDYGSFIPGYRPGKRTAEYLEKVMLRITYVGAAFLSLVAVIPLLVQNGLNVDFTVAQFLGGTGLLIVVSVCLDLVQKIDSHLVMRNYSGLVNRK